MMQFVCFPNITCKKKGNEKICSYVIFSSFSNTTDIIGQWKYGNISCTFIIAAEKEFSCRIPNTAVPNFFIKQYKKTEPFCHKNYESLIFPVFTHIGNFC